MEIKIIKNFDSPLEYCKYYLDSGEFYLIKRKNEKVNFNIGFYCNVKGGLYGVIATLRGPVYFHNSTRYYLTEIEYQFRHQHIAKKKGKFEFILDGNVCESVYYDIPLFTDYDVWSEEKDVDFFQWLCQSQENQVEKERFHQFYISE